MARHGDTQPQKTVIADTPNKRFARALGIDPMKQIMLLLCTWVLWGNMTQGFQPFDAYATKEECMQELAATEKAYQSLLAPKSFRCLPDTIDPRGVKKGG